MAVAVLADGGAEFHEVGHVALADESLDVLVDDDVGKQRGYALLGSPYEG